MSEVEWWGGGPAWDGTQGVQDKAGYMGWPQAGGKDTSELLKDNQRQRGTGPCWGAGPMGDWSPLDMGLVGDWSPEGCWVSERLMPLGCWANWSPPERRMLH